MTQEKKKVSYGNIFPVENAVVYDYIKLEWIKLWFMFTNVTIAVKK